MITEDDRIVCGSQTLGFDSSTRKVTVDTATCTPANWYYDQEKWQDLDLISDAFSYMPTFKNVTT